MSKRSENLLQICFSAYSILHGIKKGLRVTKPLKRRVCWGEQTYEGIPSGTLWFQMPVAVFVAWPGIACPIIVACNRHFAFVRLPCV